jgi:hypothetical protein
MNDEVPTEKPTCVQERGDEIADAGCKLLKQREKKVKEKG